MKVVRRFVRVGDRGVHYLRGGEGPPVVLLHYAELSATALTPLLEMLASDHTVFAFDHPGHGDSDALGNEELDITEVADALSATLAALDMPACPIYGTHTGAAVALELGRRHPEQASALIIDGPCMFEPFEEAYLRSDSFMPDLNVRHDGSHLLSLWVRMRDGVVWLPWNQREQVWRFSYSLLEPGILHCMYLDMLRGGDAHRAVYRSAITDGREAAAELTVPATYVAAETDILHEHLGRLPELKDNQEIVGLPAESVDFLSGMGDHLAAVAQITRKYRVDAEAPADPSFQPKAGAINRRYVDPPAGQILVRSAGEGLEGKPLLLLHDGRGSSRVLEPLIAALASRRPVYAVDIPDNGASDPLAAEQPGIADYADAVASAFGLLELDSPDLYATGAGAAVALELLGRQEFAAAAAVLEAPDFYAPDFAGRLAEQWVPPIAPAWDGAHLNRLWLMLRDEYAFWPWFDRTPTSACTGAAPTEWKEMHARVVEIVRSLPTYHRLTMAALDYDWSPALREANASRLSLAVTERDPRRPHAEAAAEAAGIPAPTLLSDRTDERATQILDLLDR
jgi:pimeloyl-ACP methyl ester carboxylesterase